MKHFLKVFIQWTKPLVRRIAEAYDIKTYKHCLAEGGHPLIIANFEYAKNNIPKSVYFNTMSGSITIGENAIFGGDVMLLTGTHYNIKQCEESGHPLHYRPEAGGDITIGNGCFIASGAIVIGKVSIGDYSVVCAGAVVTKDVPSRSIVAGVPARVIRTI